MDDVKQVEKDGSVTAKRRFDARDFDTIADFVAEEFARRSKDRSDIEKQWTDIDRQVAMQPDLRYKKNDKGEIDAQMNWLSEIELPLQAQALEILDADARRFMKPDTGNWFRAHAEMTDEYLKKVDFQSLVKGDETEVPSKITQDNADKLAEGFATSLMKPYDFWGRIDKVNAESFKYGMGVARGRLETRNVYIDEARGVRKDVRKIPVFVPCSIKNLFLDDAEVSMHSAQVLGPAHIWRDYMKFESLALAASRGSTDPNDEDGGWMPAALKKLSPDKEGYVTLLEMEGDLVVPRRTVRSVVIPNAIVTVAMGGKSKTGAQAMRAVIRFRFRKLPFSSYMLFPYHYESVESIYPTSPLMKGRPLQALASAATNRLLDSAMLKVAPPVGYDRSDPFFAANGGPRIVPFAKWATSDPQAIKAHTDLGGDPATMASMMGQAIGLYADVTGILPSRIGAQTKSHTTAFAKDAELQRGAVRTIDYVNQVGGGAMLKWLDMAYRMGRETLTGKASFYIEAYGGYVEVDKEHLPENVAFDWLGAGGPQDESQRMQNRVNALLLAAKLDQINLSTQKPGRINVNNAIDQVLREGGWSDLDAITNHDAVASGGAGAGALGPGPVVAAVQNLAQQMPQ